MPIRMKASEQYISEVLFNMYPAVHFLLQSNFCVAKFVETKKKSYWEVLSFDALPSTYFVGLWI